MPKISLIEKAKKRAKRLARLRQDPRFLKTMGKLKRAKLLEAGDVPEYRGIVFLEDALWAAQLEPRIYELLPAIILRRPQFFSFFILPKDLEQAVNGLKTGHPKTPYQDIEPKDYKKWHAFVGRKKEIPKIMKTLRLSQEDINTLKELAEKKHMSATQIIRDALKIYAKTIHS